MKQKLRLFAIHQTVTSLQRTNNLNPRTRWYPALDESNRMKSAYFTIHPSKSDPPQNGCRLKFVFIYFKSTGFTSSTFPLQPNFLQNQLAAITLNTSSPQTLILSTWLNLIVTSVFLTSVASYTYCHILLIYRCPIENLSDHLKPTHTHLPTYLSCIKNSSLKAHSPSQCHSNFASESARLFLTI